MCNLAADRQFVRLCDRYHKSSFQQCEQEVSCSSAAPRCVQAVVMKEFKLEGRKGKDKLWIPGCKSQSPGVCVFDWLCQWLRQHLDDWSLLLWLRFSIWQCPTWSLMSEEVVKGYLPVLLPRCGGSCQCAGGACHFWEEAAWSICQLVPHYFHWTGK